MLKETSMLIRAITLYIAAFAVADSAGADSLAILRPQAVESVGTFCHTGVVKKINNLNFAVKDNGGGYHFHFALKKFDINQGDLIAVAGDMLLHEDGSIHERANAVKRLGTVAIPPPRKISISDLSHPDVLGEFVTVEGTLVLIRQDELDTTVLRLMIKDGAATLVADVSCGSSRPIVAAFPLGARLRLTGVVLQGTGGARRFANKYLLVDGNSGVEMVGMPPTDIFDVPALDLNSPLTPKEMVRMDSRRFEGVVLATWGGNEMMVAGCSYCRVRATLSLNDELPAVGQNVAVVGFPTANQYGVNLQYARCKTIPGADDSIRIPPTVSTTLRQLFTDDHGRPRLNGYSHGRLLRISGSVLDIQPSMSLFSLNSDGITAPVDCSASPDAIDKLETGSKIEIVVLAIMETEIGHESITLPQTRGLKLILRSAEDLKVVANPPWWTPGRLSAVVIFLVILIVFIVVANRIVSRLIMRRKVSERTRLAVELHDSLSQTLAGVACQIAAGQDAVRDDPEAAQNLLMTAERMLESSRTELKNCLFDLRSDTVDDPDFTRAIEKTLLVLKPQADISIRFNVQRSLLTDASAHAVLCIIRELVSNAIRHGAATRIRIAGTVEGKKVLFSVQDNGFGFDPKCRPGPREGHFGLAGIHERLAAINGSFSIKSKPGLTRISANIVLP